MKKALPKLVIVTGGSGYIGQNLVAMLQGSQTEVLSVYRRCVEAAPSASVVPIYVDLSERDKLQSSLGYADAIVHLAWEREAEHGHNLACTQNIIDVASSHKVPKIVFVSSVKASSSVESPYLLEKYYAEALILNSDIEEKLVLRTSSVYGGEGEGEFIQSVRGMIRSKLFYPLPAKECFVNPVHVKDLCRVIVSLLTAGLGGRAAVLELVGGRPCEIAKVFEAVSDRDINSKRVALRSFLGNSLLKYYARKDPCEAELFREHLDLGVKISGKIRTNNPYLSCVPGDIDEFGTM